MKEQLKQMLNGINKQELIKCIEQSGYINSDSSINNQSVNRNIKQVFNRNNSKVIGLRKFHNKIKESVFKKIVQIYPNKKELTLLEISVGRGGDIRKWDLAGINNVYGFDIDPESITEARNRLNDYQVSNKLNKNNVVLEVGNALSPEKLSSRLDSYLTTLGKDSFDFVSCQFALHYFFKNEKYLKDILQLVSNYLSPGGYFFGTVVNGNKLVSYFKLLPEGVSVIDNDYYNIKFVILQFNIFRPKQARQQQSHPIPSAL
jgi:mRNA (guanine-N7-)-methyltransferase